MFHIMCAWRSWGVRGRRRKLQKLAAAKASAERNVSITSGWLTCSRTLFAWRHVTMRMHASRLSLHENLTRHDCTSMAATFKAWSMLCVITKNWKRIFARVSQRVSQGLIRRCLTQWQLYAHNPKPKTSKPDPYSFFPTVILFSWRAHARQPAASSQPCTPTSAAAACMLGLLPPPPALRRVRARVRGRKRRCNLRFTEGCR